MKNFKKDLQYYKFCAYGFIKNLQFFDPYLILFFIESGIQYFQIGVLFGIREIATNVLEIPTGVIADFFGRRKAMMAAFAAYIVSFLFFYLFSDFRMFIVAMVFFSVGEAFRTGTHKAMILDYLKRNDMAEFKIHYYGHTRSWSQRGSALSALIAAAIVFSFQVYRNVFLFTMIPYIFGFLLIRSYPKYLDFSSEADRKKTVETEEEQGLISKIIIKNKAAFGRTWKDMKGLIQHRELRFLLLNSSLYDGVFKASKDYVQPVMKNLALALPVFLYFQEQRRVALVVGLLYFCIYIFTSVVSQNSGIVSDKLKSPGKGMNISYIVTLVLLVAVGICMQYNAYLPGVLFFIGIYLMNNLRRPMTLGYVSDRIKGTVMATGLSIESQLKTLIVAILSPLFGAVADGIGLGWAFALLAVVPLLLYPLVRVR